MVVRFDDEWLVGFGKDFRSNVGLRWHCDVIPSIVCGPGRASVACAWMATLAALATLPVRDASTDRSIARSQSKLTCNIIGQAQIALDRRRGVYNRRLAWRTFCYSTRSCQLNTIGALSHERKILSDTQ
jgi:hypothetical protein